ncbi:MAG TPA: hypothetical protein VLK24_12075 [Gaiellaceae bacterium]|nr:hypothetical protein [Gaiellaceae bacterium]
MLVDLGGPVGQVVAVLAQDPAPPPGKGEEFGKASPVALVVLVLLFLATILLVRSMNKQLRKVPASFDEPDGTQDRATPDSSDATAAQTTPSAVPTSGDEPGDPSVRS